MPDMRETSKQNEVQRPWVGHAAFLQGTPVTPCCCGLLELCSLRTWVQLVMSASGEGGWVARERFVRLLLLRKPRTDSPDVPLTAHDVGAGQKGGLGRHNDEKGQRERRPRSGRRHRAIEDAGRQLRVAKPSCANLAVQFVQVESRPAASGAARRRRHSSFFFKLTAY